MNDKKQIENFSRYPIITVAGHIDHGKTTLISYVCKSCYINKEYGGITQHIRAYNLKTKYGYMTFLDTPGHFAFNSLRENSIKYSDIVLLIIAIDDGIKPQTVESINIAKKYSVPIIIAVNKIDKIDNFNKNSFKNDKLVSDLSSHGIILENWGGDTILTYISAKTGYGIDELLELIKIQSDMLNLKVDYNKPSHGIVLDNKIDLGLGAVATLVLKNGKFKIGDFLQINDRVGKVKKIFTLDNVSLKEAYPSLPVNVTGLSNFISIGEIFTVSNKIKEDKKKSFKGKSNINIPKNNYNLDYLVKNLKRSVDIRFNIILKADVQGSLNVLKNAINDLATEKVKIDFVKIELGDFNKSDLDLAVITNSILLGFNIKIGFGIKKVADNLKVKFYIFNVIYDLIDFIKIEIKNKEDFVNVENFIGTAEIRKIFKNNGSNIAGCTVVYGKIKPNLNIKIFRKNNLVYEGFIECIKVFKNIVNEVKIGNDCGITVKGYNDFQIGDKINFY